MTPKIMKKLICLFICFPLLFACKKDDTIPKDHRRIKQITISNDAIIGAVKIFYSYENNLLVNRTMVQKSNSSYNTWDTTVTSNYTYSGNVVTAISYLGEAGELHLAEKAVYEFTDKRMDRMTYFEFVDGAFISRREFVFNFNGGLLESFDYYSDMDENGILNMVSKGEYLYEDQHVVRFRVKDLYYDAYFYKEDFVYKNGLLDNWISSEFHWPSDAWKNLNKEQYTYNADNFLEKTRFYDWYFDWYKTYSVTYQYDQDNLIKEEYSDYTYGLVLEYIYEEASGNSEQLLFTPLDRVYNSPIIENIYDGSLEFKFKNKRFTLE